MKKANKGNRWVSAVASHGGGGAEMDKRNVVRWRTTALPRPHDISLATGTL